MGLLPHQKVNKAPGLCELVRKKRLGVNLTRLARALPEQYDFVPKTWVLPRDWGLLSKEANMLKRKGKMPTLIIKPVSGARGQGIWMTKDIGKIDLTSSQVVQTYLNNPHLIYGHKFDMRVYALITCNAPLRLYVYREGIARFATERYVPASEENLETLYMHLTNYSINKKNKKFTPSDSKNGPGSKWSLTRLFEYMQKEQKVDTGKLWERMKDLILKTFISVHPQIQSRYKRLFPMDYTGGMCFELVGFDIMLDSDLNAYVLEVNRNPSLNMDTDLDKALKGNVTADTLRLVNPYPVDCKKTDKFRKMATTKYYQEDPSPLPPDLFKDTPRHPKNYATWEDLRYASRQAFERNQKGYKAWQLRREVNARKIREAAEDKLVPFTKFERIYPLIGKPEELKKRQAQVDICFEKARQVWAEVDKEGVKPAARKNRLSSVISESSADVADSSSSRNSSAGSRRNSAGSRRNSESLTSNNQTKTADDRAGIRFPPIQ